MSSLALLDATTWVSGFDFTTRLNELSVGITAEAREDTTFGTASSPRVGRSRIGGLLDVETELNGFWESLDPGSVDAAAFTGLSSTLHPVTHSVSGAQGDVAYMYQARTFTYQLGDEVGAVLPFTLTTMNAAGTPAVRGRVAAQVGEVLAVGPLGAPVNLGPSLTGEAVYAALHVFTAGTTITVEVQRSADQAFTTPVTVATIGPVASAGGFWSATVNGADVTEPWYRLQVTSVTGTFTAAGAVAIR